MMSFKTHMWVTTIAAGLFLCSSGLQLWLYLSGVRLENEWVVLVQVVSAIAFAAMIILTYRRTWRSLEQARAEAMPPPWHPPSANLG